jgi:hypothetical protein
MTSAIVYNTITTNYPVAGQDNDSQGFRDNFTAIHAGLAVAKTEITALQTNGIDVTKSVNNLQGSTVTNGLFNQFSGAFLPLTQSANTVPNYLTMSADFTLGAVQQFTIKYTGTQINFTNWPINNTPAGANYHSSLKIILKPVDTVSTRTITFGASLGGTVKKATGDSLLTQAGATATMTLGQTGLTYVLEAWTVDSGQTVLLRTINTY